MEQYIPNIITGLVSISALLFAYFQTSRTIKASKENLDRQLRVQLATTIEKEWIHNVRIHLAVIVGKSLAVARQCINKQTPKRTIKLMEEDQIVTPEEYQFLDSISALSMLLNPENEIEYDILMCVNELRDKTYKTNELFDLDVVIELNLTITDFAHTLFKSKNVIAEQ